MTRPRLLAYAPQRSSGMAAELGRADYSYWFVLNYFLPVLREVGDVHVLQSPGETPPGATADDVRLMFLPPHRIPRELLPSSVPVFAWEYDSIPTEAWGEDPAQDWGETLRRTPGAITHSRFAADVVGRTLGDDYLVSSMPAPLWDTYSPLAADPTPRWWTLELHASVLDSWTTGLRESWQPERPAPRPADHSLAFDGVVYTTVANPDDGRKNWQDMATAFVWAHRDNPDATLIIKVVHFDADLATELVWGVLRRLGPFQCRVVVIHGYLEDAAMRALIRGTSFTVNSSRGEGQCLPLMEFMSAGVPAVAPDHTAMAEYVNTGDGFPVSWTTEWTHWPHDPRRALRCLTYPPSWNSLRTAFRDSYRTAVDSPARYQEMSRGATESLRSYCSRAVVTEELRRFLHRLAAR